MGDLRDPQCPLYAWIAQALDSDLQALSPGSIPPHQVYKSSNHSVPQFHRL